MNLDHKPHFVFFSVTEKGSMLAKELEALLKSHFNNVGPDFEPTFKRYSNSDVKASGGLAKVVSQTFCEMPQVGQSAFETRNQTILIFTCAVGIAVRMLAPYVSDKLKDPACIVLDDHARFAISLLSGHIGKANAYTHLIADCLSPSHQTMPVITTATDTRGIEGFEEVMTHFRINLEKNRHVIKTLNAALVEGQTIGLLVDPFIRSKKGFDHQTVTCYEDTNAFFNHQGPRVVISLRKPEKWLKHLYDDCCYIFYSQSLVLGTGCRKAVPYKAYYQQLIEALSFESFSISAIGAISSVRLKAEEMCINKLSETLNVPFITHEASALSPFTGFFEGSDFVEKTTGIRSIAGPSAYILSQDELTFKIYKKEKCTFSFGRIEL